MEKQDVDKLIVERFNVEGDRSPLRSKDRTRQHLAKFFGEMGFKIGAEIGVWQGEYSAILSKSAPSLHLLCIDPWKSFRRHKQRHMDVYYDRACRRLNGRNIEIIKKPSMEVVRDIPNNSLDFVYIDEMHEFDPEMLDLICWSDKVRPGGIVSGHDYSPPTWYNGVKLAVDTYTQAHGIESWYITSEETSDHEAPSFFWVKP